MQAYEYITSAILYQVTEKLGTKLVPRVNDVKKVPINFVRKCFIEQV